LLSCSHIGNKLTRCNHWCFRIRHRITPHFKPRLVRECATSRAAWRQQTRPRTGWGRWLRRLLQSDLKREVLSVPVLERLFNGLPAARRPWPGRERHEGGGESPSSLRSCIVLDSGLASAHARQKRPRASVRPSEALKGRSDEAFAVFSASAGNGDDRDSKIYRHIPLGS
jgi:hypothetical protein